jgi:hypothetical protein
MEIGGQRQRPLFVARGNPLRHLAAIVRNIRPQAIYLNSFFAPMSLRILLARRLGTLRNTSRSCWRRELSAGARFEAVKKRSFLRVAIERAFIATSSSMRRPSTKAPRFFGRFARRRPARGESNHRPRREPPISRRAELRIRVPVANRQEENLRVALELLRSQRRSQFDTVP